MLSDPACWQQSRQVHCRQVADSQLMEGRGLLLTWVDGRIIATGWQGWPFPALLLHLFLQYQLPQAWVKLFTEKRKRWKQNLQLLSWNYSFFSDPGPGGTGLDPKPLFGFSSGDNPFPKAGSMSEGCSSSALSSNAIRRPQNAHMNMGRGGWGWHFLKKEIVLICLKAKQKRNIYPLHIFRKSRKSHNPPLRDNTICILTYIYLYIFLYTFHTKLGLYFSLI
jgi:hypothetical protein